MAGDRGARHGYAPRGRKMLAYVSWVGMNSRCSSPTNERYDAYGGRGITVCARWQESFENFLADMGHRPTAKHTLDRINVNGNYEPSNCRWATPIEQARNKRPYKGRQHRGAYPNRYGRWYAAIRFEGKLHHIGTFDTPEEASSAYAARAAELGVR